MVQAAHRPTFQSLERGGQQIDLREGAPAHLPLGWWQPAEGSGQGLSVLANPAEGELRALPESSEWSSLEPWNRRKAVPIGRGGCF